MELFTREPVGAGSFYPGNAQKLKITLKSLIKNRKPEEVKGLISPHAGYMYSGKIAGLAYERLNNEPKTFVILGPNHTGLGEPLSIMYEASYFTPLGKVRINQEMAKRICNKLKINNDFIAHSREHSIEVQLPFLQYVYGNKFKIIPIVIGNIDFSKLEKLGNILANENCIIIASSDFTHYGPVYDYTDKNPEKVKEDDLKAIDLIMKLKPKEFYDFSSKGTICGFRPITTLIQAMKNQGAKPKFLKYGTSADITGDYNNFVGYASLIFV